MLYLDKWINVSTKIIDKSFTLKVIKKLSREVQVSYSIIYSSRTGNTALLAKQIRTCLKEDLCNYYIETESLLKQDFKEQLEHTSIIFIGFWTDKGTCDENTFTILKELKGKKVFLFGTAGFGGDVIYFDKIISNVKRIIDASNEILGSYMCQGRMPEGIKQKYIELLEKNPSDRQFQRMIQNYEIAESHPDIQDLENLDSILKHIKLS